MCNASPVSTALQTLRAVENARAQAALSDVRISAGLRLTRMRRRGTGAFSDVSGLRGAFWSAAVFCRSETLANDLATHLVGLRRASLE